MFLNVTFYWNFDKFNWETMDPNRNDFEDEETEEEKIEIGPDKDAVVQEVDPTVQDLPGRQDLSSAVTDLAADLPVHVGVIPKKRLENQMIEVEEVEELANPIAEVQQWVLKDVFVYCSNQWREQSEYVVRICTSVLGATVTTSGV